MSRRLRRSLVALVLAGIGLVPAATPARAECPYFPIPPASAAIPSAREIIVGTVLENVGDQIYHFRLRVDQVLRGTARAGTVRDIDSLFPGWPITQTEDGPLAPCEPIPASPDNVIVLASGALAPDGVTRYTAASWINGLPLYREASEIEQLTLAEVRTLSALPMTDTTADGIDGVAAGGPETIRPSMGLLLLAAALGAAVSLVRSRDRRAA